MGAATPIKCGSIGLHPAIDSGVIDVEPTFQHHLFEVSIAERIAKIPAHT